MRSLRPISSGRRRHRGRSRRNSPSFVIPGRALAQAHTSRHRPRKRATQYSAALVIEPKGRGVLDPRVRGDDRERRGCPTGKSPKPCLPPVAKIYRFAFDPKHLYERAVSCPLRGAYHGRHETLARDAMDAGGIEDERYRCGRQSRVVLPPDAGVKSCGVHPQGDGGKQARSPGRARNKP